LTQFTLPTRYYRAIPIDRPSYETVNFELNVDNTALVGIHCWNIGCVDGPAINNDYCVGMGWPQATEEAGRIMSGMIRPAMDSARSLGMNVVHVESDWMDTWYPDMESRRSGKNVRFQPIHHREIMDRAHGPEYLQKSPIAHMRRAEIVSPIGNESLFFYSDLLDTYLKERGIKTLIYAGFATDMCVLNAEGGARAMLERGYRCILIRDATVGVETPQSFPERLATRYGIHIFEWKIGYSTTFDQLCNAFSSNTRDFNMDPSLGRPPEQGD